MFESAITILPRGALLCYAITSTLLLAISEMTRLLSIFNSVCPNKKIPHIDGPPSAGTCFRSLSVFQKQKNPNDTKSNIAVEERYTFPPLAPAKGQWATRSDSHKNRAKMLPASPNAIPVPAIWIEAAAPVGSAEPVSVPVAELSLSVPVAEAPVRLALMVLVLVVLRLPAGADEPIKLALLMLELTTGTRVVFIGIPGSPVG